MLMKTDVLCGFWKEGEPAREFWVYVSDSEDDSDYDSDINRGFRFRAVNSGDYDSDTSDDGGVDGGALTIYPGPDHQHSRYHLRDFSQTAIKKYNHDTCNKYEFVELVKASVVTTVEAAFIVVIFKACQTDDTMVAATSFKAEARSASKTTLTNSYDIETVAPLHYESDISSEMVSFTSPASSLYGFFYPALHCTADGGSRFGSFHKGASNCTLNKCLNT